MRNKFSLRGEPVSHVERPTKVEMAAKAANTDKTA